MKISYEFYPPKDLDYKKVVNEYSLISSYGPSFISITYGAMGGSQEKSFGLIKAFRNNFEIDIVAHITLVGKSKAQLNEIITEFKALGVKKVVALRGDSLNGRFQAHPEGFTGTADFVEFLVKSGLEDIVSAYPEPHPDSEGFDFDISLLKAKTLAGSSNCITQFCFSVDNYQRLINKILKEDIQNELTAGIMPIYNINSLCSMADRCGIEISSKIVNQFSDNPLKNEEAAISICAQQVKDLQNMGVNNFHFFTLNQSSLLKRIFDEINN